jgi:hypothetical protein
MWALVSGVELCVCFFRCCWIDRLRNSQRGRRFDLLPGMTYEVDWPFQVSALFGMALYYSSPTGYYAQYSLEDPSGDVTLTLQDYGVGCLNPAVELASRHP